MEEGNLRDLEVVDKVRETDGSGIIIGEILCLFTYMYFPHIPSSPCVLESSAKI